MDAAGDPSGSSERAAPTLESLILFPVPSSWKARWKRVKTDAGPQAKPAFTAMEKAAVLLGLVASVPVIVVFLPFGLAAVPFFHVGERLERSGTWRRSFRWVFLGPAMALIVVGLLAGGAVGVYAVWCYVTNEAARGQFEALEKAGGQWIVLAGGLVLGMTVVAPRIESAILAAADRLPGVRWRVPGGHLDRLVSAIAFWTGVAALILLFCALLVGVPSLRPEVGGVDNTRGG